MKLPLKQSIFGHGQYRQHVILDGNLGHVATFLDAKEAAEIVCAVNSAPALEAALSEAVSIVKAVAEFKEQGGTLNPTVYSDGNWHNLNAFVESARAALAQSRGQE